MYFKSSDVHEKRRNYVDTLINIAVNGEQSLVIFSFLETTDCSSSIINSGEGYALPSAFHCHWFFAPIPNVWRRNMNIMLISKA